MKKVISAPDPTREEKLKAFDRLLTIMNELRENCPWDKKQTLQEHLIELNWEAVPLFPGHPMQLKDGTYTRQSPAPALNLIRHDKAVAYTMAEEETGYYRNFPEDWKEHFPGLE